MIPPLSYLISNMYIHTLNEYIIIIYCNYYCTILNYFKFDACIWCLDAFLSEMFYGVFFYFYDIWGESPSLSATLRRLSTLYCSQFYFFMDKSCIAFINSFWIYQCQVMVKEPGRGGKNANSDQHEEIM